MQRTKGPVTRAYKLLRKRKNGTLGSLFVDRRTVLVTGQWYEAVNHQPRSLKERPGWHCLLRPCAPHLSSRDRVWCEVMVRDVAVLSRPASQGGAWLLAREMRIERELSQADVDSLLDTGT